jgi:tetratricopeptide (TPR) repeat protein
MRRLSLSIAALSAAALLILVTRATCADEQEPRTTQPPDRVRITNSADTPARSGNSLRRPAGDALDEPDRSASAPAKRKFKLEDPAEDTTAVRTPKATPSKKMASQAEDSLQPVVDADEAPPVTIEATSFKGVIPGTSTQQDVAKAWGKPRKTSQSGGSLAQLYSVEPFKRIELNYAGGKVSSIVIRLDNPFPLEAVTKHLDLASIRPVAVFGELGELLGRAYPERGVLLSFEPSRTSGKPSMKVAQIILEPISAEPFVLRAEATMKTRSDLSRRDLEQALNLDPGNARAHWLYSRVMSNLDQHEKALKAASHAVKYDSTNAQYRVTYAQALAQAGRQPQALEEAQKAIDGSDDRPHVKARATCLAGDLLASGPKPDFAKALAMHTEAVKLADSLASDEHPAIRVAAKEVLVDAHLSAAHDIAWGQWKEKGKAVARWLDRAAAAATDLVENEGGSEEQLFRVHARSLAAYVGLRGEIDPAAAAESATTAGEKLVAAARDPQRKAQLQWELGTALYDAVQVCQMRSDSDAALRHGQVAAKCMSRAIEVRSNRGSSSLLGRLCFRLGTVQAVQKHDHKAAVEWFDKAVPLMNLASTDGAGADFGRVGEAFVSMGVSYWETGNRDKALTLTQQGVQWMERAADEGTFDRAALAVPYGNLAAMHQKLGSEDKASRFQEMASRIKAEKLK